MRSTAVGLKAADIIGVKEDPMLDIAGLKNPAFVTKNGRRAIGANVI